ncbi:MAG: pitrilysin family protein [Chloroherpetonaceae bacterium]|nr:pitrilysin family protein [Chloroherpetonaceae bacterium]
MVRKLSFFIAALFTLMFIAFPLDLLANDDQPKKGKNKIQFVEYDLPNGLHVILHQDKAAPVVSSYVLYHVGSKNEKNDRTGFAHFFEHLMFEGSENIRRGQIDKLISGAGGNLNASTSFDLTDYYINLPKNQWKLALWIESERMLHAKIDSGGVETQREVVKEERRLRVDNRPYGTLFETIFSTVLDSSSYSWTPIGSFQYIDKATIDEFRDFYRAYYVPNNATLCLAGDIDIEEAKKVIIEYFGSIPKGKPVERPKVIVPMQFSPKELRVEKDNTPLPATLHGWKSVAQTHPDAKALEMLSNVLSSGNSSRLNQTLVQNTQVAVQVQAFPFFLEDAGMNGVFAVGNSGVNVETLDSLISLELEKIAGEGITEEEFQKVRNQIESQYASSFGTVQSRARELANYYVFYGNTNLINTEVDEYMKVTREDIQRVAKKYFNKESRNLIHYTVKKRD